jgi:hypothetical protein
MSEKTKSAQGTTGPADTVVDGTMSKSVLQRKAEIQGLATAILLPSEGVFGGPTDQPVGDVGPLTSVVGIGLFQRTVPGFAN